MDTRPRPITDYKIVLPSLNNAVLTTDEHQENFFIDGVNMEELPEGYFLNVSSEDRELLYKYTKFEATEYANMWGKNLLTNLDREIKSIEDVKTYLYELIENNEIYNFCNDAREIVNWVRTPSIDECYKLDALVYKCLDYVSHEDLDGIVLDRLKELNRL